jgi:glyoxylase-like metal-dependent hydrolase (beta-lactamase superfamily II)/rhodanese-related sulfurtransferase
LRPIVETVRTEGLGDSTYLLIHDGVALVVDPQRDIDRFEAILERHGAETRAVLETHLHNDYVSGGKDLALRTGAQLIMPAGAAPAFRHLPAFHQEDIEIAGLVVRPLHTPGHTPEHTSYLILLDGTELVLFSGGSLLVGSAGRTDLLGEDRAESLARLQYGSVNRLAELPRSVELYPTHGEGSFCTTAAAGRLASTIGTERDANPVLAYSDEDSFVKGQLSGLPVYPSYYRHMGPINLIGLPTPTLQTTVLDEIPPDVTIIDARPRFTYAEGHLPGSLGVELRDTFGTWIGWITEHDTRLALVLDEDQDAGEALRQLARIGYDRVVGIVRPDESFTETYQVVSVEEVAAAAIDGVQILDVRAPHEWEDGVLPGSILSHVPDVARQIPAELDRDRTVWLVCGTGYRATIAASLLQRVGFDLRVLAEGGATDVIEAASKSP